MQDALEAEPVAVEAATAGEAAVDPEIGDAGVTSAVSAVGVSQDYGVYDLPDLTAAAKGRHDSIVQTIDLAGPIPMSSQAQAPTPAPAERSSFAEVVETCEGPEPIPPLPTPKHSTQATPQANPVELSRKAALKAEGDADAQESRRRRVKRCRIGAG